MSILNGGKQNRGQYCSKECMGKAHQIEKVKCSCKQCNMEVDRFPSESAGNVFCSSSCAAKYNNSIRMLNRFKNDPTIKIQSILDQNQRSVLRRTKQCKFCYREFVVSGKKNKQYCSQQCSASQHRKKIYEKIGMGEVNGHASHTLRQYLISVRGCKCEICGITEWGGKPLLVIMDHINGNSNDNSLSNLRLICSNCDTLTPTYKARNKGHGRHYRRLRYNSGKSY